MTIRFLRAWNGYTPNQIATLDTGTETSLTAQGIASATLTGGNTSNPGDVLGFTVVAQAMMFGDRPLVGPALGKAYRFYDVGGGGASSPAGGGSFLFSNGLRWKPMNGEAALDAIDTANTSILNAAEQQLNPNHATIPAGLIGDFDRLIVFVGLSKSGATDTKTLRLRYGPLGTTADPLIASVAIAAATLSAGFFFQFRRNSATTLQRMGNTDTAGSGYLGQGTTAFAAATTVSDMDANPMFLTISSQSSGATDSVSLVDMLLKWSATDT
jgi:hypothetical protein